MRAAMRTMPGLCLAIAALSSTALPLPAIAGPSPRGVPVALSCTGPVAAAGRQVAKANALKFGQAATTCFGKMQIYDGANFEYVASGPAPACPKGKAIDVYGKSRAGSWYSFFEKPVCGSTISIGPKNQWGDWMLTIDGKQYDSRGAYYSPVP